MDREKFSELLNRYIEGKATQEEIRQFDSFYESFQQNKNNRDELDLNEKEKIKLAIYSEIKQRAFMQKQPVYRRMTSFIRIAAAFLIILGIGYVLYMVMGPNHAGEKQILITQSTKNGEKKEIILCDSTHIMLNAGSKIIYPEKFSEDRREVVLKGEAFFNVSKSPDKPFIIKTGEITTTVLGTTFDVCAYQDEDTRVTVSSGNVKVSYEPSGNIPAKVAFLTAGQQAIFDNRNRTLGKFSANADDYSAWQKNILVFERISFSRVVDIIERNYNVKISCSDTALLNRIIKNRYQDEQLEKVMSDLQFMLGFNYRFVTADSILIKK